MTVLCFYACLTFLLLTLMIISLVVDVEYNSKNKKILRMRGYSIKRISVALFIWVLTGAYALTGVV